MSEVCQRSVSRLYFHRKCSFLSSAGSGSVLETNQSSETLFRDSLTTEENHFVQTSFLNADLKRSQTSTETKSIWVQVSSGTVRPRQKDVWVLLLGSDVLHCGSLCCDVEQDGVQSGPGLIHWRGGRRQSQKHDVQHAHVRTQSSRSCTILQPSVIVQLPRKQTKTRKCPCRVWNVQKKTDGWDATRPLRPCVLLFTCPLRPCVLLFMLCTCSLHARIQ